MGQHAQIVIVDDEVDLALAYAEYLSDLGHEVTVAQSGAELDARAARGPIDLVLLDLTMPGERGLDVLRRLRAAAPVPVLILTANPDPIERVLGLELGADDFVVKPVDPQELAARVASLLRRYGRGRREVVAFERASVDLTASRLLRIGAPPERLGPGEVLLVRTLAAHPNRVLTRDELLRLAPGDSHDTLDRAMDARIARLRQKLGTACIVTVRGRGYMFVPRDQVAGAEGAARG
ncbi:response regulator transcription factor [Methylobacterium nonmethylotrophicum]|uniref:Response regulator transcription factor n=1 Tax=Methylobacterium nonmethylotrophicum TaxID=1141884 RepID=A0A4Z0NFH6_9HYPH|nr:response regulator transcription factor [Methylobacterium nonmethylotrophicum]TGD94032.1 response regulator transcription factor [Methylobacterium nonmethylotrophicum]